MRRLAAFSSVGKRPSALRGIHLIDRQMHRFPGAGH